MITLTLLLASLCFLVLSFLCLIALHGGNIKKAAEDFAEAFADGIDQAVNTNQK
jgi:hypothetical protein